MRCKTLLAPVRGSTTHSGINQAAPSRKFMIIAENTDMNTDKKNFRAGDEENLVGRVGVEPTAR